MGELNEIDHYEIEIRLAPPDGFLDRVFVNSKTVPVAKIVAHGGIAYERYGEDDEWTEIRLDYIVDRRFRTIYKEPPEDMTIMVPLSPIGAEASQLQPEGVDHGS